MDGGLYIWEKYGKICRNVHELEIFVKAALSPFHSVLCRFAYGWGIAGDGSRI